MESPPEEMVLDPIGPGRYRALSSNLSMAGPWQVDAQVRRKGVEDVVLTYVLAVSEESPGKQAAQLPPLYPLPPNALTLVVELLGAAVVCLAAVWRFGGVRTRQGLVGIALAIVFASAGGVYQASGQLVKPPGSDVLALISPIPPDETSIALGQQLFQQNCVVCHGPQGRGDGPAASGLRPRPVDLTQHVNVHPEGQIFDWITNGVAGSAMPAFRDRLSDEERWHIYNYVKSVLGSSPAAAKGP